MSALCRGQSIFHKHSDGHRPYAAGNGSDGRGNRFNRFKVHIAAKLSVFVSVHSHIDYDSTLFYHISGNKFGNSHSGNKNIRSARFIL